MDVSEKKTYCTDVKNVKQWLHSTKERCDSLKYHMKYLKILYQDMPKMRENKKNLNSLNWQNSKIMASNNDESIISNQINSNDSLEKYSDTQCTLVDANDKFKHIFSFTDVNLENTLSKIDTKHKEQEPKILNKQNKKEIELCSVTPRSYDIPQNITEREEYNNHWQHPYEKHLAEYATELIENNESSKNSFEQSIFDNQNKYIFQEISSARDDMKLNISDNVKDESVGKNKIFIKHEKKERTISSALSSKKGSSYKLDDIVSLKIKKRKRKIHSSNSKSTVTTRDTNCLGKKDAKKRKQKNSMSNRHTFKSQQTSNEVVEIYHNAAAKNAINKPQTVSTKSKCKENNNCQHVKDTNVDNSQNYSQNQRQAKQKMEYRARNIDINDQNNNLEESTNLSSTMEKYNLHKARAIIQASQCNPIINHNYEMPTLASKLKRTNRLYFSGFNFRNIPFVVGTSVTPSHNLGLNIQEVLSIMKTRHSTGNAIAPLFIRKISRGMKPVSILMEQISNQQSKLSRMNTQISSTRIQKECLFTNKNGQLLEDPNMLLNCDEKGLSTLNVNLKSSIEKYQDLHQETDTRSENQLNMLNKLQTLHATDNKMLKLFASQQNVKTKMEIPDIQSKICQLQSSIYENNISNISSTDHSQDSKGIQDVLINLHDQFEEMNLKYEKLQAKTNECSNKELEEEILHLEKELSVKEDEINTVVNLYKEVMTLKREMRLLQERNGYICISSEIPLESNKLYPIEPFTSIKSYRTSFQRFHRKRGNSLFTPREPTSLRLTGFLRQIQTFQKQLKLTSW
ncbi:uncharacterized protein LOC143424842 [Xylocopa sonorina]|uniref:uncharacterized protein LOC143424842 n=1 Tax=Xylocopa sonorina TaxID=1818115 RepID=UPI00403AF5E6